jgi:small-conductance mechanosensitive channel
MSDLLDNIQTFSDRYPLFEALAIILGFVILARILDRALTGTVRRLAAKSETDVDDRVVEIAHRPIFTTVASIGLILATLRLQLADGVEDLTITAIQSILVIVWILFTLRLFRIVLGSMRSRDDKFKLVQPTTEPLLANTIAVVLFLAAVYSILVVWDINITGLVASAGIIGLALSFAAQDTLSNLFAGVAILSDRPYQIGDFIILDTGERGEVTRIGLRSTRLITLDDVEVSIPNGVMGSTKIINEAGGPADRYRIRTGVGVAYGSDVDRVVAILDGVATDHPRTLSHPKPRIRFTNFGDSSLDFEVLAWIEKPKHRDEVLHELNMEIYKRFNTEGVAIPFPQQDVYIKQMPTQEPPRSTGGPSIENFPPRVG